MAASRRYPIPDDRTEQLVVIVELKDRGSSDEEDRTASHRETESDASTITKSHGVRVADLVLVPPGSIPITTSGKVRRSASVERYRRTNSAVWMSRYDGGF